MHKKYQTIDFSYKTKVSTKASLPKSNQRKAFQSIPHKRGIYHTIDNYKSKSLPKKSRKKTIKPNNKAQKNFFKARNSQQYNTDAFNSLVTIDNYDHFSRVQVLQELNDLVSECLKLRKENAQMKEEITQQELHQKQRMIELDKKINEISQKNLQFQQEKLQQIEHNIQKYKAAFRKKDTQKAKPAEFRQFFNKFMAEFQSIDEMVMKYGYRQSNNTKLSLAYRLLRQSYEYLREKKYKFYNVFI